MRMTYARVYLAVPYEHKDAAKAAGARWDAGLRRWYLPEEGDIYAVQAWLVDEPLPEAGTVRLAVMLVGRLCYRCRRRITCVVGLRLPQSYGWIGDAFIDIVPYLTVEQCGAMLDPLLDALLRNRLAIGPLDHRSTRPRREGYVANTCTHCGATQGAFPLGEDVDAFLAGDRSRVPALWQDGIEVDFPVAALHSLAEKSG